jgi:Ca2+-binding EF-hand superfamily protein
VTHKAIIFRFEDFRYCFQMFDKNDFGYISSKDLGQLLRAVGQNPTLEEISEVISATEQSRSFSFQSLGINQFDSGL